MDPGIGEMVSVRGGGGAGCRRWWFLTAALKIQEAVKFTLSFSVFPPSLTESSDFHTKESRR